MVPLALAKGARALLERSEEPCLDPFLAEWPEAPECFRDCEPGRLPVLRWLRDAVPSAVPGTDALVRLLVRHADELFWGQTYGADDFGARFLERYAWSEIIGERGPIPSHRIACGFLMLGPATTYPQHRHEAEEVYVPIAGVAHWWRGGGNWTPREPGLPIHHSSWTPHAVRTGDSALIALYVWRAGDLTQKSVVC